MNETDQIEEDWVITLRPMKGFLNIPSRRMAWLLKFAKRTFGFKAVDYRKQRKEVTDGKIPLERAE